MVLRKEFFGKLDFEEKSADETKKHAKLPSWQIVIQFGKVKMGAIECFLLAIVLSSADNLCKQFGPRPDLIFLK